MPLGADSPVIVGVLAEPSALSVVTVLPLAALRALDNLDLPAASTATATDGVPAAAARTDGLVLR